MPVKDIGRLLFCCRDRHGLVAEVSSLLTGAGANIISLEQHSTELDGAMFIQRTVFRLPGLPAARDGLAHDFTAQVAGKFDMDFQLTAAAQPKRVAILASKEDHCLLDLLCGNVDLVVLARYMQILSRGFLDELGCPVISSHHSFLPAFIGAAPYRRAKERGVKLVGATAHYVTEGLDDGPIIEQDVVRIDHRHSIADLVRLGADVERVTLARAVGWHCQDRVVRYGNQTVVF